MSGWSLHQAVRSFCNNQYCLLSSQSRLLLLVYSHLLVQHSTRNSNNNHLLPQVRPPNKCHLPTRPPSILQTCTRNNNRHLLSMPIRRPHRLVIRVSQGPHSKVIKVITSSRHLPLLLHNILNNRMVCHPVSLYNKLDTASLLPLTVTQIYWTTCIFIWTIIIIPRSSEGFFLLRVEIFSHQIRRLLSILNLSVICVLLYHLWVYSPSPNALISIICVLFHAKHFSIYSEHTSGTVNYPTAVTTACLTVCIQPTVLAVTKPNTEYCDISATGYVMDRNYWCVWIIFI